jgi:hypothetical protein
MRGAFKRFCRREFLNEAGKGSWSNQDCGQEPRPTTGLTGRRQGSSEGLDRFLRWPSGLVGNMHLQSIDRTARHVVARADRCRKRKRIRCKGARFSFNHHVRMQHGFQDRKLLWKVLENKMRALQALAAGLEWTPLRLPLEGLVKYVFEKGRVTAYDQQGAQKWR